MAKNRFEGWYYKQRMGDYMLSFIPGRAASGAFVQVIDSHGARRFEMPDFHAEGDTIHTGNCVFSPEKAEVHLPGIDGTLCYGKTTPLRSDIMGPFAHLPMQCRHGVVSMRHTVNGSITVDGVTHVFEDGVGYAEKDSGRSFPRAYLWVQCNEFEAPCDFMLSVAHIPFLGFAFTGCICALRYQNEEYRFATYRGVKIRRMGEDGLALTQQKLRLEVTFRPLAEGYALAAPKHGQMSETIRESCDAYLHLRLLRAGETVFSCESNRAVCELRGTLPLR